MSELTLIYTSYVGFAILIAHISLYVYTSELLELYVFHKST